MNREPLPSSSFLDGIGLGSWARLLARQRFRVSPRRIPGALVTTALAPLNSALGMVQSLAFGSRPRAVHLDPNPVFIIGHWRSGTTLLFELLALDRAHSVPSYHHCLTPKHFLLPLFGRATKRILAQNMPSERMMDSMKLGPDVPAEEEFALCNLGCRSPYLWVAFPNGGYDIESESLGRLPSAEIARWKSAYLGFVKSVALAAPGRLILKNPPNGFRLALLEEMFPDARYIHITRHPAEVLSSTVRMWRQLRVHFGYQNPRDDDLLPHVLETGLRLHRATSEGRERIAPERWYDLRYEDLIEDPDTVIRSIYRQLDLGDYGRVKAGVDSYLAERTGFRTRTRVSQAESDAARAYWSELFDAGGYA